MRKIFGIGLAKTGTTTLSKALEILGYKSVHVECDVIELSTINYCDDFSIKKDVIENNDAIIGAPLCLSYKKLAAEYPDSLFILTSRDVESWLRSCSVSFTQDLPMDRNHHALHRGLFNTVLYDKAKFLAGYYIYWESVVDFFSIKYKGDFGDRLLVFQLCSENGWFHLCNFLDKDIPNVPFPHENKRDYSKFNIEV